MAQMQATLLVVVLGLVKAGLGQPVCSDATAQGDGGMSLVQRRQQLGTLAALPEEEEEEKEEPGDEFTWLQGACRTSSGSSGTYTTVAVGAAQCRERCTMDAGCVAYEQRGPDYCELHHEAISHADPSVRDYTCYVRVASAPALPAPATAPAPAPAQAPTAGPVPMQSFRELQGACRTASGSRGNFEVVVASSSECQGRCASEASCVAFEHGPSDRCELHREVVDHAEVAARGYTCWVREQPAPADTLAPVATPSPAAAPTGTPTLAPTPAPTPSPTQVPTTAPTAMPTPIPTPAPTGAPTPGPGPALGSDACSAFRSEPEGVAIKGRRISGYLAGMSQVRCCQECGATPGCEGFTLFLSLQEWECYLYANVTGRYERRYPGIVSLVKRSVTTTVTTTTTTATTTTTMTTTLDAGTACFYNWQETGTCPTPACEFIGHCIEGDSRSCPEIYRETGLCTPPRCWRTQDSSCIDNPARHAHLP